jgi:hypothetical protein
VAAFGACRSIPTGAKCEPLTLTNNNIHVLELRSSEEKPMKIRCRRTLIFAVGALVLLPSAFAQSKLTALQKRLMSGFASHELDEHQGGLQTAGATRAGTQISATVLPTDPSAPTSYVPAGDDSCAQQFGSNIKINQNCLNVSDSNLQGRAQAQNETAIAADQNHPQHLVAAYNDYRRGDGTCGVAYSLDGGRHWSDGLAPVGFTRGAAFGGFAREYWQANGDPSVAWDTKGNAYLACQSFMRGLGTSNNVDFSSAVYVFRSTQNSGASWNFPGRPVVEDFDITGATLEDKPYMTVDDHEGSPFQDRVYVTWTEFAADGTAYIWESHSNDYGEHFSARVLVSSTGAFCNQTYGLPTPQGSCNENQDSQPFTGSDGALYVVYNNYNNLVTGLENHNQILLVKSTDGGASFGAPVKVADYYDLPDCLTYQGADAPRACVPEKGATKNSIFRADNYPSGAANPRDPQQVVVTFGSYINRNSKESTGCAPNSFSAATGQNLYTGVKAPGTCANQILLSMSSDGGMAFTGGTQDPRVLPVVSVQASLADAFWQWTAYSRSGTVAVSYYDRSYGSDNLTGFLDVTVSWSHGGTNFSTRRATSSSMPPPTQFSGLFFGDYAGLAAGDDLHPIWMDTRDAQLFLCPGTGLPLVPPQVCTSAAANGIMANDQEIFTINVSLDD